VSAPYARKDNEFIAWYPLALTREDAPAVWQPRRSGYYVHIPFCTAICDYCGFAVDKLKGGGVARYLEALHLEIERYAASGRLSRHRFVCGHFGGGTPSAIDAGDLMRIKKAIDDAFDVAPDAEVTVEVNPISFTLPKGEVYARGGVNRISFGVQSFNDRTLATIGRPHRTDDIRTTLDVIRAIGWTNYSIDLIYGVPGQTLDELRDDLLQGAATGAAHISAFRLEIIPMTALKLREAAHQLPPRLSIGLLDEMDDLVADTLTRAGYVQVRAPGIREHPQRRRLHRSARRVRRLRQQQLFVHRRPCVLQSRRN
jgi:oxygen-independent coproporphyrinogen-3 oxidase